MFIHKKEPLHEVRIDKPDPQFAEKLLEQFGGATGELSAALQYFVQSFHTEDAGIRDMLLDISTEEFGHLEMVGLLIEQHTDISRWPNSWWQCPRGVSMPASSVWNDCTKYCRAVQTAGRPRHQLLDQLLCELRIRRLVNADLVERFFLVDEHANSPITGLPARSTRLQTPEGRPCSTRLTAEIQI